MSGMDRSALKLTGRYHEPKASLPLDDDQILMAAVGFSGRFLHQVNVIDCLMTGRR
jgi:hypothetical protein